MKRKYFAMAASALALGVAAWTVTANAQGPMWDRVNVTIPYTVTVGDKTLTPGDYVFQQNRSIGTDSRVLLIYSDNGTKFETTAMTIPAVDAGTPEETKLVLNHYGPDYYIDKIWIQGKNYGYEFPVPDAVKSRQQERAEPVSVAAKYEPMQPTDTNESANASASSQTTTTETNTTAQNATTTATAPDTTSTAQDTTMMAQNTPPADTSATSNSSSSSTQDRDREAPAAASTSTQTADRDRTDAMPKTSAGWLMMLLSGAGMASAGWKLRRR
jgi:hypothetical protein